MSIAPPVNRCACGTPIPPRWRKCDACIVGGPTERKAQQAKRTERVVDIDGRGHLLVASDRDVVLACGHVISSRERIGETVRCPLHRRDAAIARLHDGREVPVIQP